MYATATFIPTVVALPILPMRNHHGIGKVRLKPRPSKRVQVKMASKRPPEVKPVFYRNPSKAIEKGGGFYIPGLRGPRLRYFVSMLSATLLTLNHVVSPNVDSITLRISEFLAVVAILTVFTTALLDKRQESMSQDLVPETTAAVKTVISTPPSTSTESQSANEEVTTWALTVCTDLTSATHVAVFHNNSVQLATDNVQIQALAGPVIDRVISEARSLYIADSAGLPDDVTLPFLGNGSWSIFVVPVRSHAVAFATPVGPKSPFSVEDRRWLEAFATRLVTQIS